MFFNSSSIHKVINLHYLCINKQNLSWNIYAEIKNVEMDNQQLSF